MDTDLKFDYHAALKRVNLSQSSVDLLRDTANNCELLPKSLTDKQLLLFLSKCNGDIEKSIKFMHRHYEIKRKNPQLFKNRDINIPELQQVIENQYFARLPQTEQDDVVCYHALANPIPKNYHYNHATNCFLMMLENAMSIHGPSRSLVMLYDMKNFRLGHLTRNNLKSMKGFFTYMQEGMTVDIGDIHIFNTFPSFNLVLKLISPFLKAEVVKKMHLHSSDVDLEKLHAEHISKSCLPCDNDYGGICDTVENLHIDHTNELLEMKDYFVAESKQLFGHQMSLLFEMFARFREVLKSAYNYKEALDRENLTQENVNLLREKLKSSKVVPQSLADKQLIFFLTAYKNDVDKSAALLESCYKLKRSAPEFFKDRIVDSKEVQNCLDNQYYITLPVTPDNHMLIYHSLKNNDPNSYNFDSAAKTFIMTNEAYNYYHGPRPEVIYLFDLKGLGFRFLFKPSVSSMRKGIKFLEGGMPYSIKAVHVFNTVSFFDWIIAIVKPLLNSELLEKLHLHHSDLDYDKFHEQYIPKTHLPNEYGGTLGTLEELQQQSRDRLMNLKDYFIYEEQQAKFEFDQFVDEHLYEIQNID